MRVAFTGPSGTGKTTLAAFVAEETGLPVNPVGARSVALSMGFTNPYDVDRANGQVYQTGLDRSFSPELCAEGAMDMWKDGRRDGPTVRPLFQNSVQLGKIAWEISHQDGFVTDRTPLDDMVYALLHCPDVVDRAFIERAQKHMMQYDRIFICPVSGFHSLADDPARVQDLEYHHRYEAILLAFLSRQGCLSDKAMVRCTTWLDFSSLNARKALVMQEITHRLP